MQANRAVIFYREAMLYFVLKKLLFAVEIRGSLQCKSAQQGRNV
ncbi:hypothetical protein QWZ08_10265 [Ferruginibacter paludis]|nr:hypothetical protein [Ferruginibacter paludis]MDN3656011.1 hypothetical protein [Ferruginibacter paludis]